MPTIDGERRSAGDCLRVAVAVAYGLPYDDTPAHDTAAELPMHEPLASGGSWDDWAVARGLRWCWSWEAAPIFMDRWIAVVDSRGVGTLHAVVMQRDRLLLDPSQGHPAAYTSVRPTDVRRAMWLLPAGAPDRLTGRCWRIPYPEDTPLREPGVHRQAPRPKAGRNDPCPCGSGVKAKRCCAATSLAA